MTEDLEKKYMLTLYMVKDLVTVLGATAMIGKGWQTPDRALKEMSSDIVRVVADISIPKDIYKRLEQLVDFEAFGVPPEAGNISAEKLSAKTMNRIINSIFRVGFFLVMDLHDELQTLKPVEEQLKAISKLATTLREEYGEMRKEKGK